jgi:hypothetical protein
MNKLPAGRYCSQRLLQRSPRFIKLVFLGILTIISFAKCSFEDERYKVGQIWVYDTRPGEESSRVTVVAVENNPKFGIVVSIYINKLQIKVLNYTVDEIDHMAFTKAAMDKSVISFDGYVTEMPEYKKGYLEWKETLANGDGNVFNDSIKTMINETEALIKEELKEQSLEPLK